MLINNNKTISAVEKHFCRTILEPLLFSYLAYALRRAGHRVVHAVVLADRPPQFCVGAVLLQGVGAFVPEVVVDGRVPHGAVVNVDLPRQILEWSGGHDTYRLEVSGCSFSSKFHI